MSRYTLADHLGKMVWEIDSMPIEEFYGWMAYLKLRSDEMKKSNAIPDTKRSRKSFK